MVTKPSELFDRIPSVSDLLDSPPLRGLANRWNRSIVAAGVRSFLDELRNELRQRAAGAHLPSLRELAERAARHVAELQQPRQRPAINATGRLLDRRWAAGPLADQALERLVALASGYVWDATRSEQRLVTGDRDAAGLLSRLTGAEAAWIAASYPGAICLSLAALASGREVVIAGAELGDVEPGCTFASVATGANVTLREVGAVNRIAAADYEAAVTERTAALVTHTPDGYRVVGETAVPELDELVALARDRDLPLLAALGSAPLDDRLPGIGATMPSVVATLAAGAQLVLARGDGLVGGPPCGIVVGSRELVRRMDAHPLAAAWRAAPLTGAAMHATLELYDEPRLRQAIPLVQLLSTSIDNLRHRAEHLAPQLAQANDVAAAQPVATENDLGTARGNEVRLASYGVALTAADGNIEALDERLCTAAVPIHGRRDGDRLILDLRTVFPRQDQQLAEQIAGRMADSGEGPSEPASGGQTDRPADA